MLSNGPCHWCRGTNDKTCLCRDCIECGWHHDAGPPRTNRIVRVAADSDGIVHSIQWERGWFSIPTCWSELNHVVPYPRKHLYQDTDEPVNCMGCLGGSLWA